MNHAIALIALLTVEYIADFILQSREIATKKSESLDYLQSHVLIIIGALYVPAAIILCISWGGLHGLIGAAFFSVINGVLHGLCDWNIWKGYKYLVHRRFTKEIEERRKDVKYDGRPQWSKKDLKFFYDEKIRIFKTFKHYAEDPWFYNTIGLDRLIHVSTIILLYFWFI